jgi:hypothetical protein
MSGLYEEVLRMPPGALKGLVKMRGKMQKLFGKS